MQKDVCIEDDSMKSMTVYDERRIWKSAKSMIRDLNTKKTLRMTRYERQKYWANAAYDTMQDLITRPDCLGEKYPSVFVEQFNKNYTEESSLGWEEVYSLLFLDRFAPTSCNNLNIRRQMLLVRKHFCKTLRFGLDFEALCSVYKQNRAKDKKPIPWDKRETDLLLMMRKSGKTYAEIAECLGRSVKSVERKLARECGEIKR